MLSICLCIAYPLLAFADKESRSCDDNSIKIYALKAKFVSLLTGVIELRFLLVGSVRIILVTSITHIIYQTFPAPDYLQS